MDTAALTWGLQASKVATSNFTGNGIKVAILDTGLALAHPDFVGRPMVSKSFIAGIVSANDGHGHGTHCTGTSCGPLKHPIGRRYGVAHKALIHIGKVLSDQGSGVDGGILAGIDWAIGNTSQRKIGLMNGRIVLMNGRIVLTLCAFQALGFA
ncbi:MAG: putative in family peptidase [Polaromonas sp.]|nr:putative in family peptidase [Polaromonas sp.]